MTTCFHCKCFTQCLHLANYTVNIEDKPKKIQSVQ